MHMGSQVHLYSHKPAKDTDAVSWSYETPLEGSLDVRIVRKRCSHTLPSIMNSLNNLELSLPAQSLPLTFGLRAERAQQGRLKRTGYYTFSKRLCIAPLCTAKQPSQFEKCCDVSQQWICLEGFHYLCVMSVFLMFN